MSTDFKIIENTWNDSSILINNKWSINAFSKTEKNGKHILEADGIIYSPVDDPKRPYPIFHLNLNLKWNDKFSMEIQHEIKDLNAIKEYNTFNFFEIRDKKQLLLVNLSSINSNNNVTELLNSVYDFLFPEYNSSKKETFRKYVEIWREIAQVFYTIKKE